MFYQFVHVDLRSISSYLLARQKSTHSDLGSGLVTTGEPSQEEVAKYADQFFRMNHIPTSRSVPVAFARGLLDDHGEAFKAFIRSVEPSWTSPNTVRLSATPRPLIPCVRQNMGSQGGGKHATARMLYRE